MPVEDHPVHEKVQRKEGHKAWCHNRPRLPEDSPGVFVQDGVIVNAGTGRLEMKYTVVPNRFTRNCHQTTPGEPRDCIGCMHLVPLPADEAASILSRDISGKSDEFLVSVIEEQREIIDKLREQLKGEKLKSENLNSKAKFWNTKYNHERDCYDRLTLTVNTLRSKVATLEADNEGYKQRLRIR